MAAILFILVATLTAPSFAATTGLGAALWAISGSDEAGNDWTGSAITFETQSVAGSDYSISGHFYWTGNANAYYGRENFTGTLFANNHLTLTGYELIPPTRGIITGVTYNADVTADGHLMINGTWGGAGGIPNNAWTAVQAVPEPSSLALSLLGLEFVAFAARRQKAGVVQNRVPLSRATSRVVSPRRE